VADAFDDITASIDLPTIDIELRIEGKVYRTPVPLEVGFPTMKEDEHHAVMLLATRVGGIALQHVVQHFAPEMLDEFGRPGEDHS